MPETNFRRNFGAGLGLPKGVKHDFQILRVDGLAPSISQRLIHLQAQECQASGVYVGAFERFIQRKHSQRGAIANGRRQPGVCLEARDHVKSYRRAKASCEFQLAGSYTPVSAR